MESSKSPSFITLDVEVFSEENLDLMADYFEKSAVVLANQEVDGLFFLRIEPRHNSKDELAPESCAQFMISLLAEFPDELEGLWKRATTKTFDFGFESGIEGSCYQCVISAETLINIAKTGSSFTITIYQTPEEALEPR